jgi:transcription initiation factor TFIID subunit 1
LEQEEHPPIVPNFGMGSALVNYYRKKDEKDDHVPKVWW